MGDLAIGNLGLLDFGLVVDYKLTALKEFVHTMLER